MVTFTQNTAAQGSTSLIPAGTLVWLAVSIRSVGPSKSSGANQADMEFIVAAGPYAKRKVWAYLSDPDDMTASEAAREISGGALARMLEAVGVCKPGVPDSYRNPRIATFQGCLDTLVAATGANRFVAGKITIEKGKDGYADKNRVEFLSPNPASGSKRSWDELNAAGANGVAGAPAVTAPAPAWGAAAAPPVAPPASVLTQPNWTAQAAGTTPFAAPTRASLGDDIPF
jgi:hypothetical protein